MKCQAHQDRKAASICTDCGLLMCEECAIQNARGFFFCRECYDRAAAPGPKPKKSAGDEPTSGQLLAEGARMQAADAAARATKAASGVRDAASGVRDAAARGLTAGAAFSLNSLQVRRGMAAIVDAMLAFVLALLCIGIGDLLLPLWGLPYAAARLISGYIGVLTGGTVYYVILQGFGGQTPGKRFLGVRVVRMFDNKPMGWLTALWRWVGMLNMALWCVLAWYIFGIGLRGMAVIERLNMPGSLMFAWMGVSFALALFLSSGLLISFLGRNKRGLHDIFAGTRVIDARE